MDNKIRCQSCGMPLSEEFGNFGTEEDNFRNTEFCSFCYQNGKFKNPDQTMQEMIQSSIDNMTSDLNMPLDKATELANSLIPTLNRWQN